MLLRITHVAARGMTATQARANQSPLTMEPLQLKQSERLQVKGVTKSYGKGQLALANVSLDLNKENICALAGGNGAGKSTLLQVIAGTIRQDAGEVSVFGTRTEPGSVRDARKAGVFMVFQDSALCHHSTVLDNLFLGSEIRNRFGLLDFQEMLRQASRLFATFGLAMPDPSKAVDELSGGQQKAVAIGRALLCRPRLLLLDEPTAALGVDEQKALAVAIGQLNQRGITVVFSSHSPDEILAIAHQVVILHRGFVVDNLPVSGLSRRDLAELMSGRR